VTTTVDAVAALRACVAAGGVRDDGATLSLYAQDVYRGGAEALAVVRPTSSEEVSRVVATAARFGLAIHVRGGGMSYTDAYLAESSEAIVIDLSGLDRVRHIAVEDLYAIVEPGCTWAALDAALAPHGVRCVFWGPMSGKVATVGGGMSQGAVTFGSGRNGSSAGAALGFEIVLGDGRVLRTGVDGQPGHAPFFRPYGPDLTGLFTGDAGALGIKTAITLQLEPRPECGDGLSFAFADFETLRRAVANVSRAGLATEIFGAEASLVQLMTGEQTLSQGFGALLAAGRAQRTPWRALRQMVRIARHGRSFMGNARYTASFLTEARDGRRLQLALDDLRDAVGTLGLEIPNTMAAVTRAMPFPDPMLLGPEGRRLLPLHGIFPHSGVGEMHTAFRAWQSSREALLAEHDILVFVVYATCGRSGFLYEPVIYWRDSWPALHRQFSPPEMLARWQEPAPAPAAQAAVEQVRCELIELLYRHGAVHLQIGRSYPWSRERDPAALELFDSIKRTLDPHGLINPGALMAGRERSTQADAGGQA